jgi:hypothetical protein
MPKIKVVTRGGNAVPQEIDVDKPWLDNMAKDHSIFAGPEGADAGAKLQPVKALFDVVEAQRKGFILYLVPKATPKHEPGKGVSTEFGNTVLAPWVEFALNACEPIGVRESYLFMLMDTAHTTRHISTEATKLLTQIKENSLMVIDKGGDPQAEIFLPLVDTDLNSKYVYVDYRFVVKNRQASQKKVSGQLAQGIPNVEKYCSVANLRHNIALGSTKPTLGLAPLKCETFVPFKYHELVTWATPLDLGKLKALLSQHSAIPAAVSSKAEGDWQPCLWALVLGLAETSRHHEWYYMGFMVLELINDNRCTLAQIMNVYKAWPPQAQHAVRAMTNLRAKRKGSTDDDCLKSSFRLLAWWLGSRYIKKGETLPKEDDEAWRKFDQWAAQELADFVKNTPYK